MGDVDSDAEGSCPGAKARVRVRFQQRSMGRIGFRIELESISYMWARVTLRHSFMVRRADNYGDGEGSDLGSF